MQRAPLIGFFLGALTALPFACKHSPLTGDDPTLPDNPGTNSGYGQPCNPDSVYFQTQVLPLLVANCARSGCHDNISRAKGIVLTDYPQVMSTGKVKAGKPADSKLYTVIVDTRPDKRMPPPPSAPLTVEQQNLIRKWIEQGALSNSCDVNVGHCDTSAIVTYSNFVEPLMSTYCTGCHGQYSPQGGVSLFTYAEVKAIAQSGRLYGSITHQPGYSPMPKGTNALPSCSVQKIKRWINAGMPQ